MASPQSPLAADVARRERLRRIQLEAEAQRQAEWEAWLRANPPGRTPAEGFREMAETPRLAGWTLANLPSDLAEGVARGTNWLIGQGAELLGVAGAADATALGARRIEGALDRAPLVGGLRRRRAAAREAAGILALPTEVLADPSLVGVGVGAARAGAARLARVPAELEQARRAVQALPGAMAIPAWHGSPHTWAPARGGQALRRGTRDELLLPSGRLISSVGPTDRGQAADAGLLGFLRDHDTVTSARAVLQERKQRIDRAIAGGDDALRALPAYRGAANPQLMAEQDSERLGGWLAEIAGEEGRIIPAEGRMVGVGPAPVGEVAIEAGELGQPARHTRLTGEGAQVYGAGDLYSAEAPGVARSYAQPRMLADNTWILPDGTQFEDRGGMLTYELGAARGDLASARAAIERHIAQREAQLADPGSDPLRHTEWRDAIGTYREELARIGGAGRAVKAKEAYWLTLDDGRRVLVDPEHPDEGIARAARQLRQIASGDGQADLGQAREALRRHVAQLRSPVVREEPAAALALLERARSIEPAAPQPQMYRVALPGEREQYLSWDEPLGEPVRKRLQAFLATQPEKGALGRTVRYPARKPEIPKGERGATVYRNLSQYFGSDEAASDALAAAGIPGIRYRDQMSRALVKDWRSVKLRDLRPEAPEQIVAAIERAAGRLESGRVARLQSDLSAAEHGTEEAAQLRHLLTRDEDTIREARGLRERARRDANALEQAMRLAADLAEDGDQELAELLPRVLRPGTSNFVSFRGEDVVPLARGPKHEGISAIEQRATERLGQLIDYHTGPAGRPERLEELRRLYRDMTGRDYAPVTGGVGTKPPRSRSTTRPAPRPTAPPSEDQAEAEAFLDRLVEGSPPAVPLGEIDEAWDWMDRRGLVPLEPGPGERPKRKP